MNGPSTFVACGSGPSVTHHSHYSICAEASSLVSLRPRHHRSVALASRLRSRQTVGGLDCPLFRRGVAGRRQVWHAWAAGRARLARGSSCCRW